MENQEKNPTEERNKEVFCTGEDFGLLGDRSINKSTQEDQKQTTIKYSTNETPLLD